jgi:uncharacterized protein (DUF362 family)
MRGEITRRTLFHLSASGVLGLAAAPAVKSQQPPKPEITLPLKPLAPASRRSAVSLVRGEDRRKLVYPALVGIEAELRPALERKKYVLIKPNLTSTTIQLASTHPDTIRGILDYLEPRFKGPVVIAESASGDTMVGYENFKYNQLASEFRSRQISLVDLNDEAVFVPAAILTHNVHPQPIRLAKRLLDPDAFILCAAIPKMHNALVVTMAVKNMVVGGTLRSSRKETRWSDKQLFHAGPQQMNYNLVLVAQKMAPYWGATVLDGYEGMEGDGPTSGTPVPSRLAIASRDYVAADRIATEIMGVDPTWVGYLQYCDMFGVGNYDISRIDVRGETVASLRRSYRMHSDVDRQLQWMGQLTDNSGFTRLPAPRGGR